MLNHFNTHSFKHVENTVIKGLDFRDTSGVLPEQHNLVNSGV